MEPEQAAETLQGLERLRSSTAAKARSWSAPLFAWAAAALGSIPICELAHVGQPRVTTTTFVDGGAVVSLSGSASDPWRGVLPLAIYWLVAGALATFVSVRSYRQQMVHAGPRPPMSSTDKIILAVVLVLFAPAVVGILVSSSVLQGTWPLLVAAVWMVVLGRLIQNVALGRAGTYALLAMVVAVFVPDHSCTIAASAFVATLGVTGAVLHRKELAA